VSEPDPESDPAPTTEQLAQIKKSHGVFSSRSSQSKMIVLPFLYRDITPVKKSCDIIAAVERIFCFRTRQTPGSAV
jgi:hypothetical protein